MGVVVALESPPGEAAVVGGAPSPPEGVAGAVAGAVVGAVAGATSVAGVVGTELGPVVTALVDSAASPDILRFWLVGCVVVIQW